METKSGEFVAGNAVKNLGDVREECPTPVVEVPENSPPPTPLLPDNQLGDPTLKHSDGCSTPPPADKSSGGDKGRRDETEEIPLGFSPASTKNSSAESVVKPPNKTIKKFDKYYHQNLGLIYILVFQISFRSSHMIRFN